jgi:putative ABC transport system permease protein
MCSERRGEPRMKKILLLTLANLRKGKGQTFSFFIMIVIGALLFNHGLITWLNFNKTYDIKSIEMNSGHIYQAMLKRDYKDELYDMVENHEEVTTISKRDILLVNNTFLYSSGDMSMVTALLNRDDDISMGRASMVEQSEMNYEKSIYLPYLLKAGGGYKIGDTFTMTIGTKAYSFTVAGFFEDIFFGSINLGLMSMMFDDATYKELATELGEEAQGVILLAQVKNKEEANKTITDISSYILTKVEHPSLMRGGSFNQAKAALTMTASIGSTIIVAFSLIIMIVSLIVIKFRISNSIDEDMKNMGVLKAVGYVSHQIVLAVILQFTVVAVIGTILGIGLSYSILPLASYAYAAQSGLIWEQGFDIPSTLITFMIVVGMVILTSYLSSNRIRRIPPIIALRGGITTHNFKKNHIPLQKYSGNINILLSLKNILQNTNQNIMIGLIIAAISFTSVFASIMYYNITVNDKAFVDTVSVELSSVSFYMNKGNYDKTFIHKLQELPEVEKALYFEFSSVLVEGNNVSVYITEDFSKKNNKKCYEGRDPIYDNEVAIGGVMAKELGKKIGDTITLSYGQEKEDYLVTGLIQSAYNMGYDSEITTKGYMKLQNNEELEEIYVYLHENVKEEDFIEKVIELYGESFLSYTNLKKVADSQLGVYKKIVRIIATIIIIITASVVWLILYLVIKTVIIRKRHEYGIQKAVGFTTNQLIIQLSFSYLPVVAVGALLGCIMGYLGTNPMLSVLLQGAGIMKIVFIINPILLISLYIGICFLAFAVSILVALRIRRISAYSLMNREV